MRGAPNARVVLVEYGDFDCPFCVQAYSVVRDLLRRFDGQLRFVFRHNPRGEQHAHARLAAQAAEAAALHGQFWPMHDVLFEHPKALEEADLVGYAASLGLDRDTFAKELHAASVRTRVRDDEVGGLHSGVVGTPTFFINGTHFRDKPDAETLGAAIAAALAS